MSIEDIIDFYLEKLCKCKNQKCFRKVLKEIYFKGYDIGYADGYVEGYEAHYAVVSFPPPNLSESISHEDEHTESEVG